MRLSSQRGSIQNAVWLIEFFGSKRLQARLNVSKSMITNYKQKGFPRFVEQILMTEMLDEVNKVKDIEKKGR